MLNPYRELKNFPLPLWILFLATLMNRMGTMVVPFLAIYLTRRRGFSVEEAGFILGCYGVGALVAGLVGSWLCDRLGTVRVMVFSLFVSSAIMFAFPLAESALAIEGLTILLSLFNEIFRPASMILTGLYATPSTRKSAFALNRLAINIGMSIGPAMGGLLAELSFFWIFLVDGITTLCAAFVMMIFSSRLREIETKNRRHPEQKVSAPLLTTLGSAIKDSRLRFFLIPVILILIVYEQHESTLPIFLVRDLGLKPSTYGLTFTLNTLMVIFLEFPINASTSHWSTAKTLFLGSLFFAFGFGILIFAPHFWGVITGVAMWTFGEMILFSAAGAYVANISPQGSEGAYMGIYSSSMGLAFILAPWLGSFVLEQWGAQWLWGWCFVLAMGAGVLFARARKENVSVA